MFVTSSFPRHENDFAGRFVYELVRELSNHYPVNVIAPDAPDTDPSWSEIPITRFRYMAYERFQTLAYGSGMESNLARAPWRMAQIPLFYRKMLNTISGCVNSHTILISHWLVPCGLAAASVARREGIRHIAVAHGGDVHLLNSMPWGNRLLRKILEGTDACLPVARYQQKILSALAGSESWSKIVSRVIPMGCHIPLPGNPAPPESWRDPNCFRILTLGRLVALKGTADLMVSLDGIPRVELHIAGDGPLRHTLENRAMNREYPVVFHGTVGPEKKVELFNHCDLLVCPSRISRSGRMEGVPVTVLEGLAHGCPVIATETGGIPDIIEDGRNGRLVPPGDPEQLRQLILTVMFDHKMRYKMREQGIITAREHTWESVGDAYLSVIQDILD